VSDEFPAKDLLGDPLREPRDPRGRKKHRVTDENRLKISALRADGRTQAEIAEAIGISEPTLREYYFRELQSGPAILRAQGMLRLCQIALCEDPSPAALKLLFARLDAGDTLPKAFRPPEEKAAKLGKKEQLQRAAEDGHAGTSWGGLLPN
jgi:transcription initiation factor TFIIIB Brf1 subunit/transcription initiation factor TFIIB